MSSFLSLGVPEHLVTVLNGLDRTEPFPIQRDTLPDSLAGRDLLGRGRTGSGKTLAFSLPLVARLAGGTRTPGRPRGLVLAPTRELATQIAATIEPLAAASDLRITTIFGGVSQRSQEQAMRAGVDIVVACPGRLEDLMKQGVVGLDQIEITVLDEADHMADMGFLPGVTRILAATPAGGQRLLFSATLDNGVDTLVRRFMRNEVRHSVDESSVPAAAMEHRVLLVAEEDKPALVERLAGGEGRRILFTRTKHHAKKLAKKLTASGIPAVDLQGNLSQNARERNLAAFGAEIGQGGVRVLVATDVAARGVHVDGVALVVHVDPPEEHKAYLHRSGRTARAGAEGTVVTIATPGQKRDVEGMLRQARISAPFERVDADSDVVAALAGPLAPLVAAADVPAAAAPAPRQPQGQGRRRAAGGAAAAGAAAGGGRAGGRGADGRGADGRGADGRGPRAESGAGGRGAEGRGARTEGGGNVGGRRRRGGGQPAPRGAEGAAAGQRDGARRQQAEGGANREGAHGRSGGQANGGQGRGQSQGQGGGRSAGAPAAGRTATGRPTTGAVIGRGGGARRGR